MNGKYEFTGETQVVGGRELRRVRAADAFSDVVRGELGGWIERESNLSQEGNAWVYDNARVYGDATIRGDAKVYDNACVYGNAKVYGNAIICNNAWVCNNALVYGNAIICNNAWIYGNAEVCDNAWVYGNAKVHDSADVCEYARVYGVANVLGRANICGNAEVRLADDYAVFKNCWSSGRWFTYTRSNGMWKVGCFYGTGKQLVEKAYADSELSGRCYGAIVAAMEEIEAAKMGQS